MDERLLYFIKLAKPNYNNNKNIGFAEIDFYDNMIFNYDGSPCKSTKLTSSLNLLRTMVSCNASKALECCLNSTVKRVI